MFSVGAACTLELHHHHPTTPPLPPCLNKAGFQIAVQEVIGVGVVGPAGGVGCRRRCAQQHEGVLGSGPGAVHSRPEARPHTEGEELVGEEVVVEVGKPRAAQSPRWQSPRTA